MNVLIMDTAREMLVVVLMKGAETFVETDYTKNGHSATLLPAVDRLLSKSGLTIDQIDYFCANVGPGSFTGIRIGVCTANAFAYVHKKPVLPLNTFMLEREGHETLVLDARHGNCYYQKGNGEMGFAVTESLGEVREIAGVYGVSAYERAVTIMLETDIMCEQLEPLYLKASEAECNELK